MTTRDFGFVALKLMGLFYLIDAVFSFANMVILLSASPSEAWPALPPSFAATSLARVVIYSALSFVCLFLTNTLGWWLFGDEPAPSVPTDPPRILLAVGVILIGVFLFAGNLAASVRFLVEFCVNLEGSRQWAAGDFVAFSWRDAVVSIGSVLVGAALMLRGGSIARRLSPRDAEETSSEGQAS